jgi:hypothetical protein
MIAIKDTITVQSLITSSRKMRDNTELGNLGKNTLQELFYISLAKYY